QAGDAGGVCAARARPAVPYAAPHSGRALGRVARCVRRHHGGPGLSGGGRKAGAWAQRAAQRRADPGGDGTCLPEPAARHRSIAATERSVNAFAVTLIFRLPPIGMVSTSNCRALGKYRACWCPVLILRKIFFKLSMEIFRPTARTVAAREVRMIKTKGILHVTIPVSDLARSRAFYTDILGLEFVAQVPKENPHFVFLKSGADYVLLGRDASRGRFSDIIHHAFMVDG